MGKIIVHLGAHRTATTLLQQTLMENSTLLEESGIALLVPLNSRPKVFKGLIGRPSRQTKAGLQIGKQSAENLRLRFRAHKQINAPSLFVSEENILGTMRDCRDSADLYPELASRLSPYKLAFEHVDCIVLGIRNTHHWWCSVLAYTVSEYANLPNPTKLDQIVTLTRSWIDVVNDIHNSFPNAQLVVREHPYDTQLLGPELANQTGLEAIAQIGAAVNKPYRALDEVVLRKRLEARGADTAGLEETLRDGIFDPFNDAQRRELLEQYEDDINALQSSTNRKLEFHLNKSRVQSLERAQVLKHEPPICLLHIGKTGGTFLKSVLRAADNLPTNLHILNHSETLESTRQKYGDERQLAFVIREPISRFVSAFNSRIRQGRPTYNSIWSPAEAIAFQWFANANALAEALGSEDERQRSAALFAMENIQHLKLNYQHFLSSVAALRKEKANIRLCIDLSELDEKLTYVVNNLGVTQSTKIRDAKRHAAPSKPEKLSRLAKQNLSAYWDREFEIYKYCQENLCAK